MSTKRKLPQTLARPAVNQSAKMPTKTRIDETRTAVSTADSLHPSLKDQQEPIEISSDSSSDYELDDNDVSDVEGATKEKKTTDQTEQATPLKNGQEPVNGDTEMADAAEEGDDEEAAPTFGDLLRGNTTVDVAASLQDSQQKNSTSLSTALAKQPSRALAPPSLSSLGTVLNQALRTDDADLLESCLSTADLPTVRATITRMDSALAGTLLTKLAARMHRRPGRANSLMTWVQWTLISHGGALAGRADLVDRLSELNRVLEERSRGLQSLLALKGKLDMLDSQMQLRRENKARRREEEEDDKEEEDEDEGVVYVEGEEDVQVDIDGKRIAGDDVDDEILLANGIAGESDDEEFDEESDDDMDAELVVAGEESMDEDEVDFDDVEESADEDDSEAEVAAPPAKVRKVAKSTPRKRA